MLGPKIVGQEHYDVARGVQKFFKNGKDLQDIMHPGMEELSEDDNMAVTRACKIQKFLSQPFFSVAEIFTGRPGKYVKISGYHQIFQRNS